MKVNRNLTFVLVGLFQLFFWLGWFVRDNRAKREVVEAVTVSAEACREAVRAEWKRQQEQSAEQEGR